MKLMMLLLFFFLPLAFSSQPVYADARLSDWIGIFDMNHDGHTGTLVISDTKRDCAAPPWCSLAVTYVDAAGVKHPARIERITNRGQHMRFTIHFTGHQQPFDGYLFSWDRDKLAGTTVWRERTFGFYATKRPPARVTARPGRALEDVRIRDIKPAPGPSGEPERRILPDGIVELRRPDGTIRRFHIATGRETTVLPDGSETGVIRQQVRPANPPVPPPGSDAADWLHAHAESLLGIIRGLLPGHPQDVDLYLETERPNMSIYERIHQRIEVILFILRG